ncbi:MAG TPA: hypothetical protein VFC44_09365, partial [Candidatus Saccharimonadales bacterium]|nr:hypothetical protein [Candidatus Saccharimonadales bacterium]
YYGSDIMFGFDIGGSGQQDFGMSWGGNNGQGAGQEIVVGLGRSGGDTQIQSLPYPLGLNVTHAACLQVNGTAGTFTLYVDGVQCGQVTGLVMNQVNAQSIPMINQSDSNIGQAFAGYLAEVQVYTNDNINGAVVTSVLQSKYGSLDPLVLALVGNAYVDINSNVSLTVTAPATATANGSFTVTLTSGNPAVAGNSTATLAKGTTSTNISLQILGEGVSQVTASGSGVGSVAIQVGGLTPRSVVETFHASSLTNANQLPGITDGQTVSQWNGDILGTPAYQGANGPAYHTNATLAGTPAVVFTGTNQTTLDIPNISDPTVGLTNFSIVAVFQATAPGAGGVNDGQWWNDAGIADHELPGSTYDWGLELDSGGYFEWGTGQPDHEMWVSNYNVVNPLFHVIIGTYDTLNGISTATVDDQPSIINSNLFSQPRLADDIRIGFSHDNASAFLSGELVELDFYNGALNATERTNLAATLKSTYRLIWPDQSLISIAANPPDAEIGSTVQLTITIPAGANNSTAVPVTLTSGSPSVLTVGGGSSNTITFPAGAANVQTIAAQIVGAGTSVISVSASAAGLVSNTLSVIGLAVPSAIEQFHAYSLTNQIPGIANGQAVPQWLGAILSTPANANPNAPTFHANATKSGLPSVVLNATNATSLDIPSANDPTAGLAQFSVVAVFKDYNVATNDNDSFYTEAGIADHELPGATYDWGLEINGAGEFAWGTGAPDTTVPYPTIVVSDGLFHTVIGTYDTFLGISAIYLDDLAPVVTTGLKSGARLPDDIVIGSGHPGSYLSGELAELDFYNGALSANEAETVIANLDKMYGLTPPPVSYPIAITRSGTTVQISFPTVASIGGSQLQTTTNLLGTWTVSPLTFVTNGTQNVASDSLTNVSKFYRLYHP